MSFHSGLVYCLENTHFSHQNDMACSSMILTWERWHYWHNACRLGYFSHEKCCGRWGLKFWSYILQPPMVGLHWGRCEWGHGMPFYGRILLHPSERQHYLYTLLVHLHMSSPRYIRFGILTLHWRFMSVSIHHLQYEVYLFIYFTSEVMVNAQC